jgi:hypothetical protein
MTMIRVSAIDLNESTERLKHLSLDRQSGASLILQRADPLELMSSPPASLIKQWDDLKAREQDFGRSQLLRRDSEQNK